MAKRTKKIQDYNWFYSFLRHYTDIALKLSYRTIKYVGRERIPQDGAVIYAPNHTNALMDAMVILALDRKPKVFVARADIFRNPKLAKVLTFLKIMPIMRMRDGIDEVRKNNETIEKAVDVLRDRVPFCIFPEGTHQAKYSTLPLSKGIFRIALQAQELMPDMPLYIVPVGLRYGNFFRFRSTARVAVGDPINVGEFVASHSELSPAELINVMKEQLDERMKEAIFYIPNDESYDAKYDICAAVVREQVRNLRKENKKLRGLDAHFEANNKTLERIAQIDESDKVLYDELLELGNKASALRKAERISVSSVFVRHHTITRILRRLLFIVSLPYTIPASILTLPMMLTCQALFKKLKDYAFRNSVRYFLNLIMWPILMIIYAALAYAFLPWQWALPLTLAILPAPIIAHEIYRLVRILRSDIKLHLNKELRGYYARINEIIFNEK
ncbi:MAG: 1-acyl-sn-glycerol-3-phosphate acyltransferase [Alistipes sp.]|nr:1-acyl-sn-glycerol-3-phosphate acyltransferase [Alistipes sp.]